MEEVVKKVLLLLALVAVYATPLSAQSPEELFHRGTELYREGKFREAAESFDAILKSGYVSAPLYYNLGNAYYRANELGQAALAYERALRLSPDDDDVRYNIDLLSLRLTDRIESVPEFFFKAWLRSLSAIMSPALSSALFATAWVILFGALSVLLIAVSHRVRAVAVRLTALLVPFVILLALIVGVQASVASERDEAIIVAPVVTAKTSPDRQSMDAFVVHEGLKVTTGESLGEWISVTLPNGTVGWVRHLDIEVI